jgi:hypothetical protein
VITGRRLAKYVINAFNDVNQVMRFKSAVRLSIKIYNHWLTEMSDNTDEFA